MALFDLEMIPVSSSNLSEVGYDPQTNTLRISFKSGSMYDYFGVSQDVYENLMSADSLGSYHYYNIRMVFSYQQV